MDRIDVLRSLVQVLDCGSFSAAAAALGLHKSTVSQHIQALESHLGVRLLLRTTRSLKPTPEGRSLRAHAVQILQQIDEAEAAVRPLRSAARGPLRVDVPVALGRLVFAQAVPAFLQRHPGITLELACTDRRADLVRQGIDCAIRAGDLPDSSLISRTLGSIHFGLFASQDYLNRHGAPMSPGDLQAHAIVVYRPAGSSTDTTWLLSHASGPAEPLRLRSRLCSSDSAFVLHSVQGGAGIGLMSEFAAASAHSPSNGGRLVRVLPQWRGPTLSLQLVTPTARHRLARVQLFMNWAEATLKSKLGVHLDADRTRPSGTSPARA